MCKKINGKKKERKEEKKKESSKNESVTYSEERKRRKEERSRVMCQIIVEIKNIYNILASSKRCYVIYNQPYIIFISIYET